MKTKFYICRHCGNIGIKLRDAGVPVICCGEKMHELVPNTTDAAGEKHLPVITVKDGSVCINVGAVTHPMTDEHYIEWIYLETENGGQYCRFKPTDIPAASFVAVNDKPIAVYAYCNLHGLWASEI